MSLLNKTHTQSELSVPIYILLCVLATHEMAPRQRGPCVCHNSAQLLFACVWMFLFCNVVGLNVLGVILVMAAYMSICRNASRLYVLCMCCVHVCATLSLLPGHPILTQFLPLCYILHYDIGLTRVVSWLLGAALA